MPKASAAVVGSGNIGTDLVMKLRRSAVIDPVALVGIDPESSGLLKAKSCGIEVSSEGVGWLLQWDHPPDLIFEATSASVHAANAPRYEEAGVQVVDLTPAAVGPFVVPEVNLEEYLDVPNVNMVTCGGQATIPVVAAVSSVCRVPYAEIIASISSRSAGPGTRANIDEFTQTTARGIELIGGAESGKAIIILNPAEPPMIMRDTVYCAIPVDVDREKISMAIETSVAAVSEYVPGYRLVVEPQFDDPREDWDDCARVTVFLEVEGNGDYLPPYAGNLDIMTAAAVRVGERLVESRVGSSAW